MRKLLTATIVAMVLFAVGAFAASFALNAEDIASGADEVKQCAANVDVDFATSFVSGVYVSSGATLTFNTDNGQAAVDTCDGFKVQAKVAKTGGSFVDATGTDVGNPASGTSTLSFAQTPVADVTGVSVLVDGKELTVDANNP